MKVPKMNWEMLVLHQSPQTVLLGFDFSFFVSQQSAKPKQHVDQLQNPYLAKGLKQTGNRICSALDADTAQNTNAVASDQYEQELAKRSPRC